MLERKLGNVEASWCVANEVAPVNGVNIIKVKGPLDKPLLRYVLDQLQKRHPLTRVKIVKKRGNYYYKSEGVGKIPLAIHHIKTAAEHRGIIEEEFRLPFDENGPLMRVCLTHIEDEPEHRYLIMNYLHAIGDGESVLNFVKEMLLTCNQVFNGIDFELEPLPIMPNAEKMFPQRFKTLRGKLNGIKFLLNQIKLEFFEGHDRVSDKKYKHLKRSSLETGFMQLEIEKAVADKVIKVSSRQGVSLHSSVCASILMALYEYYHTEIDYTKNKVRFRCLSFYNLRPFLRPRLRSIHYGSYISTVGGVQTVGKGIDFWDLARSVKEDLKKETKSDGTFYMTKYARLMLKSFLLMGKYEIAALAVSNVGRIKYNDNFGSFKIEEYVGYVSNTGICSNIALVLSRFNGNLRWNYMYAKPLLSDKAVEGIAARANEILLEKIETVLAEERLFRA
ncbi:MAG: condensation domain-containing protein [Chitinophagales bacterium]